MKTDPVTERGDILLFLKKFIPKLEERSVVVITSKIIAIFEGRTIKMEPGVGKEQFVEQEAEQFIDPKYNQYGFYITVKNDTLIASAGIDESNGNGYYVLWPDDPYKTASTIWSYLRNEFNINHLGIVITDSKVTPLRWGVTGIGLAYCGFKPLNDFRGKPDIFGRPLHVTQINVLDGLAAAAVLPMGEANEQTPLAVIDDLPFVTFTESAPTPEDRASLRIELEKDIFAPLLVSEKWQKGGKAK